MTPGLTWQRLLLWLSLSGLAWPATAWQRIDVDAALLQQLFGTAAVTAEGDRPAFYDDQGVLRVPGCSEGPRPLFDPDGQPLGLAPAPSDGSFAFFVDTEAAPDPARDLLLYLAGGGACWDAATCVGSALTPAATYFPSFSETTEALDFASADPTGSGAGGILAVRPDNPYAAFAKVYVPYCTGDVHTGSSDTSYTYTLPAAFGGTGLIWNLRHRGFDNLLVVLKWLQHTEPAKLASRSRVTVAGSSAGGYGALINFPVIRAALGEGPGYSIIIDSSNGVLTNGFLDSAFGPPGGEGNWGTRQNVAEPLQSVLDLDAGGLWPQAIDAVGAEYRDTRISQSTAAYDAVQSLVYLTMRKVDDGSYDPFVVPSQLEIALTALFDWSPRARLGMLTTAFTVPNYRYYLGAGSGHVHLLDPPPELVPFPTTNYFLENTAGGVYYTSWLDDMLNNPRRFFRTDWRNLSCFPNCLQ